MKKDYRVGYGNPPQKSQFQKGKSGNPYGRPRGRLDIHQILRSSVINALREKITVREGDKTRVITKLEAYVLSVVNDALANKPGGRKLLENHLKNLGQFEPAPDPTAAHTGVLVVPATLERDEWQRLALAAHERMRREKNPEDS